MDKEQVKKIIDNPFEYDESKEDSYCSMLRDLFSKKMRWVMINLYVWSFFFMALAIISAVQFFRTDQTRYHIMYATICLGCSLSIGFCKVITFVMLQRHSVKREIKRLELRVAELNQTVKNK
ncbi:MAG TPA: DUF6768 family protein [Sedimentisphaerales bacterium]|nr:DUF6768 family protein [Sedimentisphaerales bacterium]